MTITAEKATQLRAPFPESAIGKLDRGKGVVLDYVGHAATTDRLLQVDPEWTWEPVAYDERGLPAFDDNGGLWIKMTVCGHTRIGYGDPGRNRDKPDGTKEAIGDAIRNAAMRFGVALDLWHKGDLRAAQDEPAPQPEDTETAKLRTELLDDIATLSEPGKQQLRYFMKAEGLKLNSRTAIEKVYEEFSRVVEAEMAEQAATVDPDQPIDLVPTEHPTIPEGDGAEVGTTEVPATKARERPATVSVEETKAVYKYLTGSEAPASGKTGREAVNVMRAIKRGELMVTIGGDVVYTGDRIGELYPKGGGEGAEAA